MSGAEVTATGGQPATAAEASSGGGEVGGSAASMTAVWGWRCFWWVRSPRECLLYSVIFIEAIAGW